MNNQSLRLSSVEISADTIKEIDGNQLMLSLSREQISSMTLQRGIKSERPIVDVVIGLVFISLGIYIFLPMLLYWLSFLRQDSSMTPRDSPSRFIAMGLVTIPIGIYIISTAFQKRYFLLIGTTNGAERKIVFDSDLSYSEIRSFTAQAQTAFGYHISATTHED